MKKHLLVSLADENYVDYVKQLFSSAYWKGGWDGDYMLLAYKVPEEKLKWFEDRGVIVKKIENMKARIHETSRWSEVVLGKFELFKEEFKKWDTVLFLDPDIIIRYDLSDLKSVKGFNAVSEFMPRNPIMNPESYLGSEEEVIIEEIKEKYGPKSVATFNTGVVVFNTNIIKEDYFSKLNEMTNKYHYAMNFGEEPVVNLVFYKIYKKLPKYFNFFVPTHIKHYRIHPSKIDAPILHVFDRDKPWLEDNYFHKEWKQNYDNAEKIKDFNVLDHSVKKFNLFKIIKFRIYYLYKDIYMFIDRKIGQLGILLRKVLGIKKNNGE